MVAADCTMGPQQQQRCTPLTAVLSTHNPAMLLARLLTVLLCCRTELEHLRQRLSSCKTVHDLFLLTEKAAYVAKTAAAACRKRAADKAPVSIHRFCLHCWAAKKTSRMI
jgi:hypothetical protein